jgi:hypothetical protein
MNMQRLHAGASTTSSMPLFEFVAASLAERIGHGAASGGEIG